MKRMSVITVLAIGLALPAFADVTIKQTTSGKGMGMSGTTPGIVRIKGNKMRSDTTVGDQTQSTLFDLDAQKMYIFNSKKKEADVWDMAAFAGELSKNVDVSSAKASFKPNGETKKIGEHTADGHDLMISMDAAMGAATTCR